MEKEATQHTLSQRLSRPTQRSGKRERAGDLFPSAIPRVSLELSTFASRSSGAHSLVLLSLALLFSVPPLPFPPPHASMWPGSAPATTVLAGMSRCVVRRARVGGRGAGARSDAKQGKQDGATLERAHQKRRPVSGRPSHRPPHPPRLDGAAGVGPGSHGGVRARARPVPGVSAGETRG